MHDIPLLDLSDWSVDTEALHILRAYSAPGTSMSSAPPRR
jgi:hypothetical protein